MALSEKVDGLVLTHSEIVQGAPDVTVVHEGSNRCRCIISILGTLVPGMWGWTSWYVGYCAVVLGYVETRAGLSMTVSLWQIYRLFAVWVTMFIFQLERLYLLRKDGGEILHNGNCSVGGECDVYHKVRGEPCKYCGLDPRSMVLVRCIMGMIYYTSTA